VLGFLCFCLVFILFLVWPALPFSLDCPCYATTSVFLEFIDISTLNVNGNHNTEPKTSRHIIGEHKALQRWAARILMTGKSFVKALRLWFQSVFINMGSCLINVICVCLRIVVSNAYGVGFFVFLFGFYSFSCVTCVTIFFGLSMLCYHFSISNYKDEQHGS
jgi:hypothetical protein